MKTIDSINEVFEMQNKIDELKDKNRAEALIYTRKAIETFGFNVNELFSKQRDHFRNGAVAICQQVYAQNPTISRQEFIEKVTKLGVNKGTAGTQHSRIKNS